jgi:hypothetical protein
MLMLGLLTHHAMFDKLLNMFDPRPLEKLTDFLKRSMRP